MSLQVMKRKLEARNRLKRRNNYLAMTKGSSLSCSLNGDPVVSKQKSYFNYNNRKNKQLKKNASGNCCSNEQLKQYRTPDCKQSLYIQNKKISTMKHISDINNNNGAVCRVHKYKDENYDRRIGKVATDRIVDKRKNFTITKDIRGKTNGGGVSFSSSEYTQRLYTKRCDISCNPMAHEGAKITNIRSGC